MKKMKNHTSKRVILNTVMGVSLSVTSLCLPILDVIAVTKSDETTSTSKSLSTEETSENVLRSNSREVFTFDIETLKDDLPNSSESQPNDTPTTSESKPVTSDTSSGGTSSSSKPTESSSGGNTSSSSTTPSSSTSNSSSTSKPNSSTNNSSTGSSATYNSSSSGSTTSSSSSEKVTIKDTTPITYMRNQSTGEFVEEIGELAREIGQKNDLYASVMIAQAILESGSGNSSLARTPNYNLFGIKGSYKGESVEMATLEDDSSGGLYTVNAKFRKYPSYKESLEDYAMLMSGGVSGKSTFYQGAWKSKTTDYKEATKFLTGRYASDTRYHEKLNGLIETYDLTQYDKVKASTEKIEKTKETEKFIKLIAPKAEELADKNDLYASVLIAEAIIKSNSGLNELSKSNNIYQLTGKYNDNSIKFETLVNKSGKAKIDTKEYKVYSSVDEAIADYIAEVRKGEETYLEMTRSKKDTPRKVTAYLTAQNKEDRSYHKRLNGLIDTYDLTKYDKPSQSVKKEEKKSNPTEVVNELGVNMVAQITESFSSSKATSLSKNK